MAYHDLTTQTYPCGNKILHVCLSVCLLVCIHAGEIWNKVNISNFEKKNNNKIDQTKYDKE